MREGFNMAWIAGAAIVSGVLGSRSAKKAAKRQAAAQLEMQKKQFALMERQMAMAEAEDARKKGITDKMMEDAQLTDQELQEGIDDTEADIKHSFSRGRSALNRRLDLNKVNPSSGSHAALNKDFDLREALSTAGGRNTTRSALQEKEKRDIALASSASLGISPMSVGVAGQNASMYGDIGRQYGADATAYGQSANSALSAGFNTAGLVYGMRGGFNGGGGQPPAPIQDFSRPYTPSMSGTQYTPATATPVNMYP